MHSGNHADLGAGNVRGQAGEGQDGGLRPEEARRLIEESKQLLDEFIRSHPTFPEAIQAAAEMSKDEAAQAQTTSFAPWR